MSTSNYKKKENKNVKALFSVVCLCIVSLGLIVYFSTTTGNKDDTVNEPTTIVETTIIKARMTESADLLMRLIECFIYYTSINFIYGAPFAVNAEDYGAPIIYLSENVLRIPQPQAVIYNVVPVSDEGVARYSFQKRFCGGYKTFISD